MSKLRSVNTHFWSDNYVIDLDPTEKLLFLYLLTNENTNMLGIYELHIRKMAFETGIDKNMIEKIFDRFDADGKASYVDGYVCLHNFTKHQSYNTNMKKSAISSFNELPSTVRKEPFIEPLLKALKPLPKGSEPIAEYEYELELERELEEETESEGTPQKYEIPTQGDVESYFKEQGEIMEEDIPLEAQKFINHYEQEEWKTRSGKRIKNWRRQAGTWTANYKQWNEDKLKKQQSKPKMQFV